MTGSTASRTALAAGAVAAATETDAKEDEREQNLENGADKRTDHKRADGHREISETLAEAGTEHVPLVEHGVEGRVCLGVAAAIVALVAVVNSNAVVAGVAVGVSVVVVSVVVLLAGVAEQRRGGLDAACVVDNREDADNTALEHRYNVRAVRARASVQLLVGAEVDDHGPGAVVASEALKAHWRRAAGVVEAEAGQERAERAREPRRREAEARARLVGAGESARRMAADGFDEPLCSAEVRGEVARHVRALGGGTLNGHAVTLVELGGVDAERVPKVHLATEGVALGGGRGGGCGGSDGCVLCQRRGGGREYGDVPSVEATMASESFMTGVKECGASPGAVKLCR